MSINWKIWFVEHEGKLYRREVNLKHFKSVKAWERYNKRFARTCANKDNGNGYIRVPLLNKSYYAHRIIWEMAHGKIPKGMEIDHIDRDRKNNKLSNLRIVTPHENMLNCTDRPSKFGRGIKQTASGKFGARLHNRWLGSFDTVGEAQIARKEALVGE